MNQRENKYEIKERRKHQDATEDILHTKRHHCLDTENIAECHDKWEETQDAQNQDRFLIRITLMICTMGSAKINVPKEARKLSPPI